MAGSGGCHWFYREVRNQEEVAAFLALGVKRGDSAV